jgi:hypothetical protein
MFDRPLVIRLICVGTIAAIMLPVGRLLFPYLGGELSGMQFQTLEAVLSATVGFGISTIIG